MSNKLEKSSAGYVYRPETQYRCGECIFAKALGNAEPPTPTKETPCGCAFFGPGTKISPTTGSCIYYTHGHPTDFYIPWIGLFTKIQLGYGENRNGFSCKRCEYFIVGKNDCGKPVDKDSEGDTPGEIHPNACCDFWEKDKVRGNMESADLLVKISAAQPRKLSLEFRKYRN